MASAPGRFGAASAELASETRADDDFGLGPPVPEGSDRRPNSVLRSVGVAIGQAQRMVDQPDPGRH